MKTTGGEFTEQMRDDAMSIIASVFNCNPHDISDLEPLQAGLTNIVLSFKYRGGKYVFRQPGLGSEFLVDRGRESVMQKIADDSKIDSSIVAMDSKSGWKIAKFIEHRPFDYNNTNDMVRGIMLLRRLHDVPCKIRWNFDVIKRAEEIKEFIPEDKYGNFPHFKNIRDKIYRLDALTKKDGIPNCYIHGDARDENFLINEENIYLIDWEYAGYGDPGFDIGSYFCGGDHTQEDLDKILYTYFRKTPNPIQKRHFYAYVAITGFFFLHWTMLKESSGQKVGVLKERWYKSAVKYSDLALKMYENGD